MKLPAFEYAVPETLAEAVASLAAGGGTAKAISGGQSLLPTLAFRLATPPLLVDLRKLPGLDRITLGEDGVRLGAKVRRRDTEDGARVAAKQSLALGAAVKYAILPGEGRDEAVALEDRPVETERLERLECGESRLDGGPKLMPARRVDDADCV